MILYDTPGVIEKKMHKLDTMMMKNVRSAVINADCVLVLVDACKVPENVCFFICRFAYQILCSCLKITFLSLINRLMEWWKKVWVTRQIACRLLCWF